MKRETMRAVSCPINAIVKLEDCMKCPYYKDYDDLWNEVNCEYETPSEKKMKPEPVKEKEPLSRW